MNTALIAVGLLVALVGILAGAAIWLARKSEAMGKREVQSDLLAAQNDRLRQGAAIDAKPVSTDDATATALKLARRDRPGA